MLKSLIDEVSRPKYGDDYWKPTELETDSDLIDDQFDYDDTKTRDGRKDICIEPLDLLSGIKGKCRPLTDSNQVALQRRYDYLSSSLYLRMKIHSIDDVTEILDNIRHMNVKLLIGGSTVITIPSLTMNLLILNKLEEMGRDKTRGVTTFNLREWQEDKTQDEIEQYVCGISNSIKKYMCRYFVNHIDDKYLDIPLLFDFFSYGMSLSLCALAFHDIRVSWSIDKSYCDKLKSLISGGLPVIYVFPEVESFEMNLVNRTLETNTIIMSCNEVTHYSQPGNCLRIYGSGYDKLLYVIIESTEPDLTVSDFPEIIKATVILDSYKEYSLDTTMFYVADYDKRIRLYALSFDPDQDMRNWIKIVDEFSSVINKKDNCEDVQLFCQLTNISNVLIEFNHWKPYIEVTTVMVSQNCMVTCGGIGVVRYSN